MSRQMRWSLGTVLALAVAGCAGPGPAWLEDADYLAPGRTTVADLRRGASDGGDAPVLGGELRPMVAHLLERSPSVAASRARYKAAIERVPQASTLPRPVLSYTYLPWPVETRVGPNEHRVQLVQAVPFPTKLAAQDSIATALARAAGAGHDRVVRDELTRLKRAWADLYYVSRALAAVAANEELAKALSKVAATRYERGRGALFDVSKAQSQLAQLGYDRVRLTEQREATVARLNAALGRPRGAPVAAPPALPDLEVKMTEDELLAVALQRQQELAELDERIRAADAGVLKASSSWLPDFAVGVQYLINGEAAMPSVADSGKDALGIMVSLSLPIWFGDQAAKVAEATATRTAAVGAKKAHLDRLQAELAAAVFRERDTLRLKVLYDEELLPQAVRAMETAEQWYRAEGARFTDFLEARGVFYSFSLARARAEADHFQAVARIEQLIGAPLTARQEGSR